MATMTYRQALAKAMREALRDNPKTVLYGLGVTDHTGIFGTTLGLEKEFGKERVFDTPISEDAMTGLGIGLALSGYYPIHTHIRNDFMLLAMNQLVNSAAKYKYMYGGCFTVPMLVRGVIGRSWGQGAQHSQSLQSLFSHVPGLTVIMPSAAQSIMDCYRYAVNEYKSPVISFEHRLQYDYSFEVKERRDDQNPFTSYLIRKGSDVTIVAVSVMVQEAQRAAKYVKEKAGIEVEIIDINCLTHPDVDMILESVKKTGKVIVADTSWASFGVCAEVARIIAVNAPDSLKVPLKEISMAKSPCPTTKALEKHFYADMGDIVDNIYQLCSGKEKHNQSLPDEEYKKTLYKEFKGPF
ncbi:MAG: pyruvate dehydrogenase E1 component subunit beta [Candidatus Saganbacteria bacterium]|uniref:Pyruvate dehydrogenase E1 component subunit beta n=1 Tax=Candidatus Saganbacteria bacterium TaxID=2575572 RepID=A0A833L2G6_UNCSA|nr:MAG: pyruvate dehydrogenase E1 component subunit beta [Candidatus Saganbacteria bacterium]